MTGSSAGDREAEKRAAVERAVAEVEDGMVLGLGSGSTAEMAVAALATRVAAGLRVLAIPTSERTAALASGLGISLTRFAEHRRLDLTIDGADQVERDTLALMKGLGGALLREKIVAAASRRMIVVVDESKLVNQLGGHTPLPVEVVPFGWEATADRLAALGGRPDLRRDGGEPLVTDNGNYILDCHFGPILAAAQLEVRLAAIAGVVESGLFVGVASKVIIGSRHGVEEIGP